MPDSRDDVAWSQPAPMWKLRRLCEQVTREIRDDESIGDEGLPLSDCDPLIQRSSLCFWGGLGQVM